MAQRAYSRPVTLNIMDSTDLVCISSCWDLSGLESPPTVLKDETLDFCPTELASSEIVSLQKLYTCMKLQFAHPSFRETWDFENVTSDGENSPCNWFGLTCGVGDDGVSHISALDFGNKKLFTTSGGDTFVYPYLLPDCVVDVVNEFSYLTEIDFSNNFMYPSEKVINDLSLGIYSLTFAGLRNVEVLRLGGNALIGNFTIAFPLDSMPKLHTLDISNDIADSGSLRNIIVGTLPCEFYTRMKVFQAKKAYLSGKMLPDDCTLPSEIPLREFNVMGSYFHGSIPWRLFTAASKLKEFIISNNLFSGEIPQNIVSLNYLEVLDLDGNYLHGTIPADMNKMTRLTSLTLNDNILEFGNAMPDFCKMPLMQTFGFSINENDAIPFDKLPQSLVFKISNTGHVYSEEQYNVPDVSRMPVTTQALAFTSGFSGDVIREGVFDELALLPNLVILSFSNYEVNLGANSQDPAFFDSSSMVPNHFPGPIPQAIDKLKENLIMLSLHGCSIVHEGLPAVLKDFSKLTGLYLGNNNFTGTIDASDFQWKNLQTIDLSNNRFEGRWPYELFSDYIYWERVDLSKNAKLGAGNDNGAISGQLCQYFENQYYTQEDDKFVLQLFKASDTSFSCYDPCYSKKMRNSHRYTYSIEVPQNAAECSISDQLYALHSVFDDLIHDTSPEHGFESWENLFSLSPDPCGM